MVSSLFFGAMKRRMTQSDLGISRLCVLFWFFVAILCWSSNVNLRRGLILFSFVSNLFKNRKWWLPYEWFLVVHHANVDRLCEWLCFLCFCYQANGSSIMFMQILCGNIVMNLRTTAMATGWAVVTRKRLRMGRLRLSLGRRYLNFVTFEKYLL